jgi:carbamoyltransferase
MNILGISAFYHDSAACLVQDGKIVAAAQEERFTRKKHDAAFPRHAVAYCLRAGKVGPGDLDAVSFYEKPLTHFVRLLRTYFSLGPKAIRSFLKASPVWLREKLWIPLQIERELEALGYRVPPKLYFAEHHESHAASAFYPSPYASSAVLTLDAVGEWSTTTLSLGHDNTLALVKELRFPHSLGLLYSAFTYFCGFKVNSGEYKLMGLAPYGEPKYVSQILENLLDLRSDGTFRMDLRYFDFLGGLTMTSRKFDELFGGPPRGPETSITKREMDLARSIQDVTEEIVLRLGRSAAMTGEDNLCLAGGVALNCVANGRLLREGSFKNIWIQPAAGDAGGALGAALHTWYQILGNPRTPEASDSMEGSYLGPSFSDDEIQTFLDQNGYPYEFLPSNDARDRRVAQLLAEEKVVGLFLGRMEFGPRALGHRSIIGDARSAKMQSVMNLKIKYRESFRPFAPSVLAERAADYFELDSESPYMLLVAPVRRELRYAKEETRYDDLVKWVNESRSALPAITHVDYSARIQTISDERNSDYYSILKKFNELTGCGVIINTSFNVRGEPIVCTPTDAYRCFMRCEMDALVLEHAVLMKGEQPKFADAEDWQKTYELD